MEILDRRLLIDNVDGDHDLLAEIISLFFESSQELVEGLRGAVSAGDADSIHRTAHQLKGALANVGATAAVEHAFRLERAGREQRLADTGEDMRQLEHELRRLEPELMSLVESTSE